LRVKNNTRQEKILLDKEKMMPVDKIAKDKKEEELELVP